MFLILKLMLIVLTNKTYGYIIQNKEIILLPAWNPAGAEEMSLTFKVFGKLVQLNMHRNDQIVSSGFEEWKNKTKSVTKKSSELKASNSCFYFYEDYFRSAAFNICQEHGLEGLVFLENDTLEFRPLQNVVKSSSFIDDFCVKEQINLSVGRPHLVKQSQYFANSDFYQLHKITSKRSYEETLIKQERFTIELAVFVNAKAYKWLMDLEQLGGDDHITVMLKFLNRMQKLFHHPSLGVKIDISLVRLEFMKEQPPSLPVYTDNSTETLYSFCKYARNLNPPRDDDPRHWDISLYIIGEDIIEIRNASSFLGKFFGLTDHLHVTEIFYSNTACNLHSSCTMVILSSTKYPRYFITPRISQYSKFTTVADLSSVAAVRQIGHLLGLKEDSGEQCFKYVMCRGEISYQGLKWSTLSRNTIKANLEKKLCLLDNTNSQNIDYDDYYVENTFQNLICENYPGRKQTAKAQCESYLGDDENAQVATLHDICNNLQCKTFYRNRVYFAGRALDGTHCALGKECCNGQCVPVIEPPYNFKYCEKDNWSEWEKDSCKSNCLVKSKGVLMKRRSCQHRGHITSNCTGLYYDVDLCDDSSLCTDGRTTIAEFAFKKCIEYMKSTRKADMKIELLIGHQMLHDVEKPWIACIIFCRQKEKPNLYGLRRDFFDSGVDRYFPDGTWCHNDDVQDYYCRQNHCLPENYSFVNSEECKNNC